MPIRQRAQWQKAKLDIRFRRSQNRRERSPETPNDMTVEIPKVAIVRFQAWCPAGMHNKLTNTANFFPVPPRMDSIKWQGFEWVA